MDREIFSQVVTDVTGRDRVQVERDILDGIVLNSEQALEYGLVHEIKTELFERGAKVLEIT
jgi:ATP-dependent protease ClpP protease subunit